MFILELLVTLFYFLLILALVALALALAIPIAALYLVYWILFKSWRPRKTHRRSARTIKTNRTSQIKDIVKKSMEVRNKEDKESLKQDIEELVEVEKDK